MSYQDDLDWLAMNVHEWPGSKALKIFKSDRNSVAWIQYPESLGVEYFTYEQWLARRAELQNKPSWSDAPEWAKFLIQTMAGWWLWLSDEPCHMGDLGIMTFCTDAKSEKAGGGELLGYWRYTLEHRPTIARKQVTPEDDNEVPQRMMDIDMYVDPGIKSKLDALSSNDQECTWHERGELPPVGTKCEYRLSTTSPWYPCEIKYVIHDDGVVMMREDGFEQFCSINSKLQPVSFRPIRTERDEAIEAMKAHCPYPGSWETTYRLFAESLYDAGYRAGGSE